ncbi:MAG: hypothetical protein JRI55_34900, partial [Deltaproteobacteria bacterium]|nr:hypothetical protein [Deltaproteobacteria bacterium]
TVYAFTYVLGGVLLGIALGGLLAAGLVRAERVRRDPRAGATRAVAALVALAAVVMAAQPTIVTAIAPLDGLQIALARGASLTGSLAVAAVVVAPAALIAAGLPLLVAARGGGHGSRAFGSLYAANTVGGVAGSLLTGFVLLPRLGVAGASVGLELVAAVVVFGALLGSSGWRAAAAAVAAVALCCGAWFALQDVPRSIYVTRFAWGERILEFDEGVSSDVMVTEGADGRRRLWINSAWVAGTGGGHRLLGHLPGLFVERPRRILGIALGTGQTFAALLDHGAERLDCVEIDGGVIELSKRWFSEANRGLFADQRVVVHRDDGRAFLRGRPDRFDVIVFEPLQAWSAGTANLYSREFYEEARQAMAPGAVVAQWIPFYGQGPRETRSMVATALSVFPEASLWLDEHDGILLLHSQPFSVEPAELRRRIAGRRLAGELSRNASHDVADLLTLFVLGPVGLRAWTAGAPIIVDDHPFLEFAAARAIGRGGFESNARSLLPHLEDPASVVPRDARGAKWARLRFAQRALIEERLLERGDLAGRATMLEQALAHAPSSGPLLRRYGNTILEWGSLLARRRGGPAAEVRLYRRALAHAPALGQIWFNLAIELLDLGQPSEAQQALRRAAALGSVPETAWPLLEQRGLTL